MGQEEPSQRSLFKQSQCLIVLYHLCLSLPLWVAPFLDKSASVKGDPTPGRAVFFSLSASAHAPWSCEHREELSCSYGNHDFSPRENTEYVYVGRNTQYLCSAITTHGQPIDHHPSGTKENTVPSTGHLPPPGHTSSFPRHRNVTPFLGLCPEF